MKMCFLYLFKYYIYTLYNKTFSLFQNFKRGPSWYFFANFDLRDLWKWETPFYRKIDSYLEIYTPMFLWCLLGQ